jgi:membrane protease YdiL (CAAX protease family)
MMSSLLSVVKRHPLITFFVLAFAFAWSMWLLIALYPNSAAYIPSATFGPLIAAFIVLALTRGKSGVKELLSRMVRWRVGLRWYAVALLLPLALVLVAVYANVLLFGASAPSAVELGQWPRLFLLFPLLLILDGPLGEEPGWRGFALPRLQVGYSALVASLILGSVWAFWHLPKLVMDSTFRPVPFVLFAIAGSILFTWVYNSTNGSVLLTILFHASINAIQGAFFFSMFSGADLTSLWWLLAVVYWAAAIVVVVVAGPAHLSRKHRKQEEERAAEPRGAEPEVAAPTPV